MLIHDRHTRITHATTGAIIRELTLDPIRCDPVPSGETPVTLARAAAPVGTRQLATVPWWYSAFQPSESGRRCRIGGNLFVGGVGGCPRGCPDERRRFEMAQYLIMFNDGDMPYPRPPEVGTDSKAMLRDAKQAGAWVFGGGLVTHEVVSVVAPDGTVTDGPYPETKEHIGGFAVVEVSAKEEALHWAGRIAAACRAPQQVFELLPPPPEVEAG